MACTFWSVALIGEWKKISQDYYCVHWTVQAPHSSPTLHGHVTIRTPSLSHTFCSPPPHKTTNPIAKTLSYQESLLIHKSILHSFLRNKNAILSEVFGTFVACGTTTELHVIQTFDALLQMWKRLEMEDDDSLVNLQYTILMEPFGHKKPLYKA